MWRLFEENGRGDELTDIATFKEFSRTSSVSQVMREDSIFIAIIQTYIKSEASAWLQKRLYSPIKRIIGTKINFSEDLERNAFVEGRIEALTELSTYVVDSVLAGLPDLPYRVVKLCKAMHQTAMKFDEGFGYRAFSSNFFLRFVCPAISAPESLYLIKTGSLRTESRKNLVLIAKLIQLAASGTLEPNQEALCLMKQFLVDNAPKIEDFYRVIIQRDLSMESSSNVSSDHRLLDKRNAFRTNLSRSFSTITLPKKLTGQTASHTIKSQECLFRFVVEHFDDLIRERLDSVISLQKELVVTQLRCQILLACAAEHFEQVPSLQRALQRESLAFTQSPRTGTWEDIYALLLLHQFCFPTFDHDAVEAQIRSPAMLRNEFRTSRKSLRRSKRHSATYLNIL